ncbi:MAG: glutamate--tRNA ligase [Gammaproteobacteria bacterium]|nr:MAG: glutamate--tRNA ligase [Gammaproteobacteria bacterium]
MNAAPVTRFAPSPTGALHLGNARTALFAFLYARARGGRFLLRVEDTDRGRDADPYVAGQMDDLRWLGIGWDAGPDREDERGPYRQSQRGEIYSGLYQRLFDAGHTYPCYCTPAELEVSRRTRLAAGLPPRYAGTCRNAAPRDTVPVLRFRVPDDRIVSFDDLVRGPQAIAASELGDFVIRRADGGPMFFFCNAVDDALMGVTQVLRGEDHLSNTPRQLLLLDALGLPPPQYGHLPLLVDSGGAPLSKRRGSVTLAELRARGYLPGAVSNYLLRLGHTGAPDAWVEPGDFPQCFAAGRLGRAPAHYDPAQLDHWQREAVKRLSPAAAASWLAPGLPVDCTAGERATLAALLVRNVRFPAEAAPWLAVLRGQPEPPTDEARQALVAAGAEFFAAAAEVFAETGPDLKRLAAALQARTGHRGAALFRPLRAALTGRLDGPELGPLLAAIPVPLVQERLAQLARSR